MAVTDLTGTKWRINSTTCTAGYGQFSFNLIKYNDVEWGVYDEASISKYFCVGYVVVPNPRFPEPVARDNSLYLYDTYPSMQQVSVGDIIEFGTGTDATNSSLISWLEANAEQIIEPTGNEYTLTQNLTNLTSGNITLTITADEGYSLPAQAGIVVTGGTIVSYDSTTGELVVTSGTTAVEVTCESATPSGYNVTLSVDAIATSNNINFYDGQSSNAPLLATLNIGSSETVTVTSGFIYVASVFFQDVVTPSGNISKLSPPIAPAPPDYLFLVEGDGSITVSADF